MKNLGLVEDSLKRINDFIKSCFSEFYGTERKFYDKVLVLQNNIVVHCVANNGSLQFQMYDDKMNISLNGLDEADALAEYTQEVYKNWYYLYFQQQVIKKAPIYLPGREPIMFNEDLIKILVESMPKDDDKFWWS